MIYSPVKWVVVEVEKFDTVLYKVFGQWSGGYLDGASWRLNSGIQKIEEDDKNYRFIGYSGSSYICAKTGYGLTAYGADSLEDLIEKAAENDIKITILFEDEVDDKLKELM